MSPAKTSISTTASPVRFGGSQGSHRLSPKVASATGEALVDKIPHLGIAKRIYKWSKPFALITGNNGMSQIDTVQRIMLPLGLYGPQQIGAAITGQHVWETFGRNSIGWVLNYLGTLAAKNKDGPLVRLLNTFIAQKTPLDPKASSFQKMFHAVLNRFRPSAEIRDILQKTGLKPNEKPSFWSALDQNEATTILFHQEKLKEKALSALPETIQEKYKTLAKGKQLAFLESALQHHAPKALTQKERQLLHELPRFFSQRKPLLSLAQTATVLFCNIYVVGFLAMWLTYATLARLDKDFEGNKAAQKPHQPASRKAMPSASKTPAAAAVSTPSQLNAPAQFNVPSVNPLIARPSMPSVQMAQSVVYPAPGALAFAPLQHSGVFNAPPSAMTPYTMALPSGQFQYQPQTQPSAF
ncbi:MAG: hypothetical protein VKK59_06080 [Vampirovibrionales bacterium]|nr:hypothetical protein [Vampirovibrionales bacterium]